MWNGAHHKTVVGPEHLFSIIEDLEKCLNHMLKYNIVQVYFRQLLHSCYTPLHKLWDLGYILILIYVEPK